MRISQSLCLILLATCASVIRGATLDAQTPPASTDHRPAAAAVDQRYRYRVLGIYDEASGDPVEGVEVSDVLSGNKSLTTATGTVSLLFLPDGGSLVRLRKVGFEVQTFPVSISPADTAPLTITLRHAVTLPTVTVKDSAPTYRSSALRTVVDRMQSHNGGYFINEAEMRKHDESTLANTMVSRLPGLTTQVGPRGETWMRSSRTPCLHPTMKGGCRNPDCYVAVYQDGVKMFDPVSSSPAQRVDFSRITSMDYAIAEYYPGGSSAPAEYGGANAPCGVLLLWSRE
jgi:hypothetical protein